MSHTREMRTTKHGHFVQDGSGLWHYRFIENGEFGSATRDAVENRPNEAAWFWWLGTPCPILKMDDAEKLAQRYWKWRKTYQEDAKNLLTLLKSLPEPAEDTA